MELRFEDIARILGAPSGSPAADRSPITCFLTDSRSLSDPAGTLFFAIATPSNDGHRYIPRLYQAGVRHFVVETLPDDFSAAMPEARFINVDSTLEALHTLAAACRRRATDAEVIAITGSRGKTIIKEWLFQALSAAGRGPIARSPRSFNSQIGVALSLLTLEPSTRTAIIEAGISRPGEMARLEAMIKPTVGVFTNLLSDHSEGFSGGDLQKCAEKSSLFAGCRKAVFDAGSAMIAGGIAAAAAPECELWGWTLNDAADTAIPAKIRFTSAAASEGLTRLTFAGEGVGEASADVAFTAPHDISNLCHVAATMAALGCEAGTIAGALKLLRPVVTRTDVMEGINGSTLIYDRYSADLTSLDMALDFMGRRLRERPRAAAIIGDMTDDPDFGAPGHYESLRLMLERRGVTDVVGVGEAMKRNIGLWSSPRFATAVAYDTAAEMIAAAQQLPLDNRPVLVKGTREEGFDSIFEHFEARRHETVLDVNLDALVNNFNFYKSRLRPSTGIVCMVKAFGYGAGSYELAKTLQSQGAAYLAVAVLDEGIELRRAGITMPIMVMNPRVVNYEEMFANRLEPEIFSFDELDEIIAQARRHGITDYPIHIKFDTGMHRLGFLGPDIPHLAATLKENPYVTPASMFSHLAAADDPADDDYTLGQFEKFDTWCDELQSHFPYHIKRHILNSTGITRFPEHQGDLVRLGICLYGVPTMADGSQSGLRRVSSLRTTVISIKEWEEGTSIGYNRRGVCRRPSRIATIPIGYADGIDRHLGNGAMRVWINGHRCPTIGNICMDACMIDVTDCGDDCHVGDSVEIFGDHVDVGELAAALGTISYEILTSVSMRVKRVYYRE